MRAIRDKNCEMIGIETPDCGSIALAIEKPIIKDICPPAKVITLKATCNITPIAKPKSNSLKSAITMLGTVIGMLRAGIEV
jgi:hypothetical protein